MEEVKLALDGPAPALPVRRAIMPRSAALNEQINQLVEAGLPGKPGGLGSMVARNEMTGLADALVDWKDAMEARKVELYDCMEIFECKSATVAALQDYATMRDIINITPQETKELYDRMISTGGRQLTGLPTSWNPQANENRLVKCLDTLDVIQERYRQAVEYMSFEPA